MEPPHPEYLTHDKTSLSSLSNFFNWSMSFRSDSDFHVPYGRLEEVENLGENYL